MASDMAEADVHSANFVMKTGPSGPFFISARGNAGTLGEWSWENTTTGQVSI